MKEKGFISNRIFDGLSCGTFIITDKVNCMEEVEQYVETYETLKELKEKIDFYLANSDKRVLNIEKGMGYVKKNHMFLGRLFINL